MSFKKSAKQRGCRRPSNRIISKSPGSRALSSHSGTLNTMAPGSRPHALDNRRSQAIHCVGHEEHPEALAMQGPTWIPASVRIDRFGTVGEEDRVEIDIVAVKKWPIYQRDEVLPIPGHLAHKNLTRAGSRTSSSAIAAGRRRRARSAYSRASRNIGMAHVPVERHSIAQRVRRHCSLAPRRRAWVGGGIVRLATRTGSTAPSRTAFAQQCADRTAHICRRSRVGSARRHWRSCCGLA